MATLGIIGGNAPGSTVDYYRLLVERYQRARPDGTYPSVLINSIDLTRFLQLAAATGRGPLVEYLVHEIERLSQAGADLALFASNTPHLVFDQVAARVPIPMLSIVEAAGRAAKTAGLTHLGLLGTRFTMEGSFYASVLARHGMRVTAPGAEDRASIHQV